MKVTKELAEVTPACNCRGYIETGDKLEIIDGTCGNARAWWVACPDCGRAIGSAMRYPIAKALKTLKLSAQKQQAAA